MCRYTQRSGIGPRRLPWARSSRLSEDVAARDASQAARCASWIEVTLSSSSRMKRLVGCGGDADLGARATGDGFVEPDPLDEGRVPHQVEQRGSGRNQRTARLFLGQSVKAAVERCPVLIEDRSSWARTG